MAASVAGTVLRKLPPLYDYEVATTAIPILLIRKLRHRKVKSHTQPAAGVVVGWVPGRKGATRLEQTGVELDAHTEHTCPHTWC